MQPKRNLNRRATCVALTVLLILVTCGVFAQAGELDGAYYLKHASVSLAQARAVALGAVHGQIVAEELDKPPGGSGLRFSFNVKTASDVHEVGVDARTGKLLENSIEGENPD